MAYSITHGTKSRNRALLRVAVGLLVVFLIIATLEATNMTHFFHKTPAAYLNPKNNTPTHGGASSSIGKGEDSIHSTTPSTSAQEIPGDAKSNTSGAGASQLITPSGDFVSNHHPNLSGQPAPNTESSVCVTTPGAKCTITFTSGSTVKSLLAETTDRSGSAYWNWKLQDIGLTAGTWKIKAVATLNGQTMTSQDAMEFVVSE